MDGQVPNDEFWGKLASAPDGRYVAWHPLVDHCIDVAAVFESLVELPSFSRLQAACGWRPLCPGQRARLAAMALLHDIGKCNGGFQSKRDRNSPATAGHVMEAAALFWDGPTRLAWPAAWHELFENISRWFVGGEDQAVQMLLASISHHGRPVSLNDYKAQTDRNISRWWKPRGELMPMQGLANLAHAVQATFPAAFAADVDPIDAKSPFQQRFAGLVMLADWIGSDKEFFPFREDAAQDRFAFASRQASHALTSIGIHPPERRDPQPFVSAFPFKPSPLQLLLDRQLPTDHTSRLVLAESDTGSGKTEAALAWFLRLYQAEQVDSLYFALPTRVAARELYLRVLRTIEAAFPDPGIRPGPVILAAPGYVQVDGGKPLLPDPDGRLWDDDSLARQQERQWAASHPKRFLAAPVAVGTIDQALLSVLKAKHALLRSVCLDRSLLVVDEVHASDPYMRELLLELLRGHLARSGRAMLLSATLGESACSAFFGRERLPLAQSEARPYPSVVTASGEHPVAGNGVVKRVTPERLESLDDADLVPRLVEALAAGARVLAICNTVSRANSLLRAVEADGRIGRAAFFAVNGVVCPHHGRFTRDDREVLDGEVSRRFGKGSPSGPLLLIGTQTLEQSLDIDADWLVSDLCPIDVLLQRIGRLHRHGVSRMRPVEFAAPKLLVRTPPGADLSGFLRSDGSLRAPAGIGTVYGDGRVLQRTLELLCEVPSLELPTNNRRLVEQATHPDALAQLAGPWIAHGHHVEGREMAQLRAAIVSTLDEDSPFGELQYRAPEDRVATRLGAGNLDLPLAHPMSQPFGSMVRSVSIPSHLAPAQRNLPERIVASETDDGFRFALGERHYRYTRFGLEIDDA